MYHGATLALIACIIASLFLASCTDNLSEGSKVGTVTDFTRKGFISKTYEGSLYLTANGLTRTSDEDRWYFSIDKDVENTAAMQYCINTLKTAQDSGWIVKVSYHKTLGTNILGLRGMSSYLVTDVTVLNKHPLKDVGINDAQAAASQQAQEDKERKEKQLDQSDDDISLQENMLLRGSASRSSSGAITPYWMTLTTGGSSVRSAVSLQRVTANTPFARLVSLALTRYR